MAVFFPTNPQNGDYYPDVKDPDYVVKLEETKGIVYQYDDSTNSWTIVGPDNIATTEWVLDQLLDDQTNLDKGYDLISATNTVGLLSNYNYTNLTECNTNADTGLRNSIYSEPTPGESGLGLSIQEACDLEYDVWINCCLTSLNKVASGEFTTFGVDKEAAEADDNSVALFSRKYKNTKSFLFSENDKEGNGVLWLETVKIGDTIEINYRGSSGNLDYIIYRVESVEKRVEKNANDKDFPGIFVEVLYLSSNDPDRDFRSTTGNTYYEFKTYKKAYSTAGGIIDGPLHVIHTATDNAIFSAKEDGAEPTLQIDTVNNTLKVNDNYDSNLAPSVDADGKDVDPDPNLLVTLSHLDQRFGGNDVLNPNKNGPFLSTKGGTLTSEVTTVVGRKSGVNSGIGNFDIRGKTSSSSANTNNNLFTTKHQSNGADYISYNSSEKSKADGILNKSQIDELIKGTDDKLDDYVLKAGSTMTGNLTLPSTAPGTGNANKYNAVTRDYADNLPMGPVKDGESTVKGQFYWLNGALYINPY